MKRNLYILILCLLVCFNVFPEINNLVKQIDQLHEEYKHSEIRTLIEGSLSQATTPKEKAELLWRLTRAMVYLGDIAEDSGKDKKEILAIFAKAEEIGEQAIQADPSNPNCYYNKSSAIGRWGQVKGILDSLAKAQSMQVLLVKAINMDPEFTKAYQVLGMLYEALPGWPVSFGNVDYAVSLARKSLDLHEKQVNAGIKPYVDYTFHKELAIKLNKRNWSAAARAKDGNKKASKYNTAKDNLERGFYYEGIVTIPNQSDKDEAFALLRMAIEKLEKKANKTQYEVNDLAKIKELLQKWGG